MTIETHIKKFSELRTYRNRSRYPALTNHLTPRKPLLLLPVMDLISQGWVATNFVESSFELVDEATAIKASCRPGQRP